MNIYFVLEGEQTEKIVYRTWMKHFLPHYEKVLAIEKITENSYYLLTSNGYPAIKDFSKRAITDIHTINSSSEYSNFNMLVLVVDSEDESYEARKAEFENILIDNPLPNGVDYRIIVQNPCIETWFLGNQKAIITNPNDPQCSQFMQFYNVRNNDPELMTKPSSHRGSIANYHFEYLRKVLRANGLSYSKSSPATTKDSQYYENMLSRANKTNHIQSFLQVEELFQTIKEAQ